MQKAMNSALSENDLTEFCSEVHTQTETAVERVDGMWTLPSWNGLLDDKDSPVRTGRPLCCFKPRNSQDVLAACRAAARHGIRISARGSGHHYGGVSLVQGGLVLDLSELNHVEVDASSRTARVGPAATGRQLRAAIAPLGLHFTLPHLSDVGLSGFILGGGNGWGVRHWGAAADNVEEMQVVLLAGAEGGAAGGCGPGCAAANGSDGVNGTDARDGSAGGTAVGGDKAAAAVRLVRVSSRTDPELFWGLRGGGSFLAVVTEFVLRLHPVSPRLPLIAATYPLSHLDRLVEFFRGFHLENPTCVEASMSIIGAAEPEEGDGSSGGGVRSGNNHTDTTTVNGCNGTGASDGHGSENGGGGIILVGSAPVKTVVLLACTAFAEPGRCEVEASYKKLRDLLPESRLSLQEGPMPYDQALSILDPAWNWPGLRMYGHGAFIPVQSLTAGGAVAAVLSTAGACMTSRRSILLVCPSAPKHPAATAAEPKGATEAEAGNALGFRDTFYVGVYGMWARSKGPAADGDAAHVDWVRTCAAGLAPHAAGLYLNEVMHDQPDQVCRSFETASYLRLAELKRRVDPNGLLRKL